MNPHRRASKSFVLRILVSKFFDIRILRGISRLFRANSMIPDILEKMGGRGVPHNEVVNSGRQSPNSRLGPKIYFEREFTERKTENWASG